MLSQYLKVRKKDIYLYFLIVWAYSWGIFRYFQVKFTSVQFDSDAVGVWMPFARAVLNGATPYTPSVWDNKPPFFQVLNIISEATGRYFLVMILFIASANAIIVYLLYRIWEREDGSHMALLIGAMYLSTLSYIGTNINSKSFGILFVILAVFSKSIGGFGRGALMSTAVLFAQQTVFVGPVMLWLAIQRSSESLRSTVAKFVFGGISTATVAYGSLAILYDFDTMMRALYYTNGITTNYFSRGGAKILADANDWLIAFLSAFDNLSLILVAAAYGAYMIISAEQISLEVIIDMDSQLSIGMIQLIVLIFLIPSLLLRASAEYWIMFLPFLASLAGIGIKSLLLNDVVDGRDIPN